MSRVFSILCRQLHQNTVSAQRVFAQRSLHHIEEKKLIELIEQKTIHPATDVRLTNCNDDIRPKEFPIFPKCQNLMIDNCGKNFFYFWFSRNIFPTVENIWIHNHPCDYEIHLRFAQPIYQPAYTVPRMYIVNTWQYRYFTVKNSNHYTLPLITFITEQDYFENIRKFNQDLIDSQTKK
jgi:hypothetical protein